MRHPPLTRLRFASAAACDDNLIDADDYLSDVETGDDDDEDDAATPSRQSPLGPASGCHCLLPEQQLGQNWNELSFFPPNRWGLEFHELTVKFFYQLQQWLDGNITTD